MEPAEHERIDVRDLREDASRYVAAARAGQRVPVTDHGTLVAYLVPAQESSSILDRLEAAGQLRRGRGTLADLPPPLPTPPGDRPASEVLLEMRGEELDELVTYDGRLADSAREHGITVVAPGA